MKTFLLSLFLTSTFCSFSQTQTDNRPLDISSGYFLGTDKVSKKEFKQILSTNQKAYKEFKNGKTLQTTGTIIATASAIYLGTSIGSDNIETEGYIAGGLGFIGGFLTMIGGKSMINKSIKTYNSSIKQIDITLGTTTEGIGLTINF
ncbi:MAG TPA: hypothetical protein VLY87_01715 [Flavobacterium sp.]|nr:hypothetical protein [Flavobacterium sp.]